jgi:succinate dehydrogenase / fumarate reductase membrane anchor subunit
MPKNAAPLRAARIRSLGSAKSGVDDAWRMHLTSIALLPLTAAFVWIVLSLVGKDYAGVRAELAHPYSAIILLLFVLAGVWHMKIGMQSIIDDYLHTSQRKGWAMVANLCFCAVLGVASIFAILKLGLSGAP